VNAEEKRAIIDRYISVYNDFDIEGMIALVHPDVVFTNVYRGEVNATAKGVDELREMGNHSKTLFSSRYQEVTGFESFGERANVSISFKGTLAVDLPNGMKAGEVLRLKGRSEFEFRDGKLFRITDYS
jgi:ketosteroid isomerase-like protein